MNPHRNTFKRLGWRIGFEIGKRLPLPRTVYIIEGWFGADEWIEAVYTNEAEAEAHCTRLWRTRRSENPNVPDDIQGLCKFAVVPHQTR